MEKKIYMKTRKKCKSEKAEKMNGELVSEGQDFKDKHKEEWVEKGRGGGKYVPTLWCLFVCVLLNTVGEYRQ